MVNLNQLEAAEDAFTCLISKCEYWGKAYPANIFSEPTKEALEWLHATRPGLIDCISASMGRHMAGLIASDVAKLREAHETIIARIRDTHTKMDEAIAKMESWEADLRKDGMTVHANDYAHCAGLLRDIRSDL